MARCSSALLVIMRPLYIGQNFVQKILQWTKQFGGIYKQRVGSESAAAVLVVTDPQEVQRLSGREENLPKWHAGYKILRQVGIRPSLHCQQRQAPLSKYCLCCSCFILLLYLQLLAMLYCAACSSLQYGGHTRPRRMEACTQDYQPCFQSEHHQRGDDSECHGWLAHHNLARALVHLQGFPVVYQNTLKAAEVLQELCKQGLVDVNDLAWRFTAGKFG